VGLALSLAEVAISLGEGVIWHRLYDWVGCAGVAQIGGRGVLEKEVGVCWV